MAAYPRLKSKHIHRIKAEKALGRPLKKGEEVHQYDGNINNYGNTNLVICSSSFHRVLHRRRRAMDTCGNPNYRYCAICGNWDDPENLYIKPNDWEARHPECHSKQERERQQEKKRGYSVNFDVLVLEQGHSGGGWNPSGFPT